MVRCPPDYCCYNDITCKGTCQSNLTEALFTAECLSFDKCQDALIVTMYVLCVVGYAVILLVSETIKDKTMDLFKRLSILWKQRQHCKKQNKSSQYELLETSDDMLSQHEETMNGPIGVDAKELKASSKEKIAPKAPETEKEEVEQSTYRSCFTMYKMRFCSRFTYHKMANKAKAFLSKFLSFHLKSWFPSM